MEAKHLHIAGRRPALVAICTGRVEAKPIFGWQIIFISRCNLHGACGGKGAAGIPAGARWLVAICTGRVEAKVNPPIKEWGRALLQSARGVWRQSLSGHTGGGRSLVAICTGRVEAKCVYSASLKRSAALQSARGVWRQRFLHFLLAALVTLQSARGVWRQSGSAAKSSGHSACCNLHGACGGKAWILHDVRTRFRCNLHGACGGKASLRYLVPLQADVAICTGRVEAKIYRVADRLCIRRCNLHGACGGKGVQPNSDAAACNVAICTGRVEAKTKLGAVRTERRVAICTGRVEAKLQHSPKSAQRALQSARGVWRQSLFAR